MVFRTGDLIPVDDASELIDSAQDCAKKLAARCAEKDAEIERLREAIKEWDAAQEYWKDTQDMEKYRRFARAEGVLEKIAREERRSSNRRGS